MDSSVRYDTARNNLDFLVLFALHTSVQLYALWEAVIPNWFDTIVWVFYNGSPAYPYFEFCLSSASRAYHTHYKPPHLYKYVNFKCVALFWKAVIRFAAFRTLQLIASIWLTKMCERFSESVRFQLERRGVKKFIHILLEIALNQTQFVYTLSLHRVLHHLMATGVKCLPLCQPCLCMCLLDINGRVTMSYWTP